MSFLVLSETDKTCVAYNKQNACINQSYTGEIIIPSEVNGYTVIEIGYNAFNSCLGVTSVSIPNTVKTIRPYAFANCSGMTSISIPSSVKNIEEGAFSYCTSLTSVNITDIEAWCNIQFSDWDGDVQRISNPLFCAQHLYLNGEEVHELSIPNTVTSIGACAFLGCTGITSVDIPSSVTSIDASAFRSCTCITSVDIPSSVTSIGKGAFSFTGLTSVTLPSHITSYNGAFAYCNLLTSAELSEGITIIDEGAFNGCTHLTSIEIPNSVTTIGRIAFGGSGLTSITLPTSVTSIELGAFAQCNGLTSITLPANVTSIGEGAFYQCSALTSVISQIQEPFAFGNSAFNAISDACVLYVPKGTKEAYIAAGWTEEVFKGGIVEMEPELVPLEEDQTVDIAEEITEETNLDGNIVGDIYYNISSGNGSYDVANGCIVVTQPTEDSAVEGKDIFGEDFKAGFTGIVFKVPAGKGTVKIQAETSGNMVMKVKIGDNDPIEMELDGKLKVSFPYNVTQDAYVYIYGSTASSDVKGMHKAPGDGELKIYGVELKYESTPTDIEEVQGTKDNVQSSDGNVYDLTGRLVRRSTFDVQRIPKGLYIKDGKKVLVK